jgi:HEAT repeat protein
VDNITNEPNRSRVDRILQKLDLVRLRNLSCFGSNSHGFQLNAPLSEAELQAFEIAHNIRLPDDYRAFLLHVGNGGAGPYYGIYPLARWDDFADLVREDERHEDFLALPCPLHPHMKLTENWQDFFGEATPYQGTLSLGTRGCSYGVQLIVYGEAVGRVVYVDADGYPPYMIREPDFLSWYERWLDELLQGCQMDWFGYGLGGSEDKFLLILSDPQADDNLKSEAAHAFRRLQSLSDRAAQLILPYLDSPIPGVRSGILATIRIFKLGSIAAVARLLDDPSSIVREEAIRTVMTPGSNFGDTQKISRLLEDPVSDVRKAAMYAVMALGSEYWVNAVLRRLYEEPDDDVASSTFFQLQKADVLSKPDLLRILNRSPLGGLRYLAAWAVEWSEEDLPLLIHLLSDSHSGVLSYAVLGLRRLNARSSLPQVLELLSQEQDRHVVACILKMLVEFADPSTVPALLEWAQHEDDFYRLEAIAALAKIGDDRAIPIVRAMLQEDRRAERRECGGGSISGDTIGTLVRNSLKESPNPALRDLTR